MDNIAYIMASKQMSSVKNLDVTTNNISNVNTNGFKADNMLFKQYMHNDVLDKTAMTAPNNTMTDFNQGSMKVTQNPLDIAVSGDGLFIIRTPVGERYTRAGHLRINREGMLVDANNYPILSFDRQEIVFEDGDQNPIIASDGTIFVGDAIRGRIGVAKFDNYSLRKLGNGLFISDAEAIESENYEVVQGMLEESNVNSIEQITLLAQIEREVAQTTHFINDIYSLQKNAFKIYARLGG